jgi:hypothetical protein
VQTALERPPSSQVHRDHVILLLINLTQEATAKEPAVLYCHTQLVGVDVQTTSLVDLSPLPDVWLDFGYRVHAWQLPADGKMQDDFGIVNISGNQSSAAIGCLVFRRCILTGLPQGPTAASASDLRSPDLWALLLWPLLR